MIFVNHAHVFPPEVRAAGSLEMLLRLMDQCEIDRAVAFAPFAAQMPAGFEEPNHWLVRTTKPYSDRIVPYGCLNPTAAEAVELLEFVAGEGIRGIKLHPAYDRWDLTCKQAMAFYEEAERRSMILDFHTGIHWHRIRDYDPLKFDEIAYHFPALRMVFEHVGGRAFFNQMVAVMVNNIRRGCLYAGAASILDREKQKAWYLGVEGLKELLWQAGEDFIIYGLDFPYNDAEDIARDLKIIRESDIPSSAKEKILGMNLEALLGTA